MYALLSYCINDIYGQFNNLVDVNNNNFEIMIFEHILYYVLCVR